MTDEIPKNHSPLPWSFNVETGNEVIRDAQGGIVHHDTDFYPSGLATDDARLIVYAVNMVPRFEDALARAVKRVQAVERYVVWSHEHAAWWAPNRLGYTTDLRRAGTYSRDEAVAISHQAGGIWGDHRAAGQIPDELPLRVIDLPEWARHALLAAKRG